MNDPLASLLIAMARARAQQMETDMPIEIKGLKETVAAARAAIASCRVSVSDMNASISRLKATCDDITDQTNALHDDISFEAQTLGNSSGKSVEPVKTLADVFPGERPSKTDAEINAGPRPGAWVGDADSEYQMSRVKPAVIDRSALPLSGSGLPGQSKLV